MGKVTIEVPIESGTLEMVRDAVLFSGEYWWMFYVCLVGFSFCNSRTILGAVPNINYFHGCALMVLANYGGSTLAMIMMSKPVVFVVNEALVPVALICFTIAWLERNNRVVNKFLADTSIGAIFSSITYEIMRCHVAMGCSAAAAASLPSLLPGGSSSRVAIVGPLIAGVLGGCGGAFMPLDKGLAPLANGTNWRIGSAALNSAWLFLSMQYPSSKAAIGLDAPWARFCAICILVVPPLLQMATGFAPLGANPLVAGPKSKKA